MKVFLTNALLFRYKVDVIEDTETCRTLFEEFSMKPAITALILSSLFCLCLSSIPCAAEEIRLAEGCAIKGTIVKKTLDHVFVDLGYTILAVPRKEILDIVVEEESAEKTDVDRVTGIWTEKDLKEMSIEDNVDRVGEGVILVQVPGALGSGSIISKDGYIITNAHVVQAEQDVAVTVFTKADQAFEKKVFKKVEIVAVNPYIDLALLKIDEAELGDFELTIVPFGEMASVKQGEKVFAIGNPRGLVRTVTTGGVSNLNRALGGVTYIQTDTPINPGNSGGPLFNSKGEMIGVNTLKRTDSDGLNFSIKISHVKNFILNRDAFIHDKENPNSGYHYLEPPARKAAVDN